MKNIAVLLTCFNRKDKTRKCLETLQLDKHPECDVFLVDDGCTDGTTQMVKKDFPKVKILEGDGTLFWNLGMRFAFLEAYEHRYDFYLWVNDDVAFEGDVISKMVKAFEEASFKKNSRKVIVTGYTFDVAHKEITYGGYKLQKAVVPIKLQMVQPSSKLEECDTFNGNCVLIPIEVVDMIGVNCERYHHSQGDVDYGLSAKKAGCSIVLTNFPVGCCEKNEGARIWNDIHYKAPLSEKKKVMNSLRHRPKDEWKYFTKKFGGKRWFLRYYLPYLKIYISAVITFFQQ